MNTRHQITPEHFEAAISGVSKKLTYRIEQKGSGSMSSSHEILGIIVDEVEEYRDEVHSKSTAEAKIEELKDIAVAAIFGIASIQSGGVDW